MKAKILTTISLSLLIVITGLITYSCNDLLEQKPPLNGSNVLPADAIQNAEDLQELLNSAYDVLANTYNGDAQNPPTLLSDNLVRPVSQDDFVSIWLRRSTIFNGSLGNVFRQYSIANLRANTVIENLDNVVLTPEQRTRSEAEAKFILALCHFDQVRAWADPYGSTPGNSHPGIAIRTGTDVQNAPRSSVGEVYNFILAQLEVAKAGLPVSNGVYATRWSAIALEAEVRFQQHNYQMAAMLANEVINSGNFPFDDEINKYQFPQSGSESIFYIFSAITSGDSPDTIVDSRNGGFKGNYDRGGNPALRLQPELYGLMTQFGSSTPRGSLHREIDQEGNISYATNMFNAPFFNIPILTTTQMMLIRAESYAETGGDLDQAIQDINMIRERAYGSVVGNISSNASASEVKNAARLERRLEFPFNGQRFHDLKRMGSQGENIIVRDAPWDCPGMILQFPATERTDLFPLNETGGC